MLIAALILALVVGVWAAIERAWPMVLLAAAVALLALAMHPALG
jgi:hypothetical protein